MKSKEISLSLGEAEKIEKWVEAGVDDKIKAEKLEEINLIEGVYKYAKEPQGKRESWLYGIEAGGQMREIWGFTVLDKKMKQIPFLSRVRIEYLGQEESEKNKGRTYHNVSVKYVKPRPEEA